MTQPALVRRRLLAAASALSLAATLLAAPPAHAADADDSEVTDGLVTAVGPVGELLTIEAKCFGPSTYPTLKVEIIARQATADMIRLELRGPRDAAGAYPAADPEAVVTPGLVEVTPHYYTVDVTAYRSGDYTLLVWIGDELWPVPFHVAQTVVMCPLSYEVTLEQAPSAPVPLAEAATVVIRLMEEGQAAPADDAGAVHVTAPAGVTVSAPSPQGDGLLEYTVTAADAGTYDIDFSVSDDTSVTVPVTFAAPPTNPLAGIVERLIALIRDLIRHLLSALAAA
jgi:hypothetical protein